MIFEILKELLCLSESCC